MKRLPIVVMFALTGSFLAFRSIGNVNIETNPPGKYEQILKLVGDMLHQAHYSPQDINDAFSRKIFTKFMADLDPEKSMYLLGDIEPLKKKYENRIDEEIKGADVEFFLAAGKVFNTRMEEAAGMVNEILARPFDFSKDEEVVLDGDKLDYPVDEAEKKERWRKKLKYMVLDRFAESLDSRDKNKGKENFVVKTDEELEKDARDRVKRLMDRTFERFRFKFNDDDKFNVFVNAITNTMDPHTEFFPPVDKIYFE